jgi:hypothetical protein
MKDTFCPRTPISWGDPALATVGASRLGDRLRDGCVDLALAEASTRLEGRVTALLLKLG